MNLFAMGRCHFFWDCSAPSNYVSTEERRMRRIKTDKILLSPL